MSEASKEMSAKIRRASGREVKEEVPEELSEALADISAGLDTIREAQAATLEGLGTINKKLDSLTGEKPEKSAPSEATEAP